MPEVVPSLIPLSLSHQRRLEWALRGMSHALMTALQCDPSTEAAQLHEVDAHDQAEALARLIMEQADPTSNKRFTSWLAREYAAGRLILEDFGSANETLNLFQRYAPRLKPAERDIQRYGSLAAAWEAVRGFAERDEARSNKAQKALDRARAYAESRILRQDPDGFTVAVPLTEFASKWWGRGTRWCTAAENSNQFWEYHRKAPLIVIVVPSVGKFQLWAAPRFCHLRDASDRSVPYEFIGDHWSYFKPLFLGCLKESGKIIRFIHPNLQSRELSRLAVTQNGMALGHVCYSLRSQEICRIAVMQNGEALEHVPGQHLSKEICRIAVTQHGNALGSVPERLRTAEMCRLAVMQDATAFKYVPEHLRRKRLCRLAVANAGLMLQHVPGPHRTPDLCLMAVKHSGWALQWVPSAFTTAEICAIAVAQCGKALEFVPMELRDEEICRIAVTQDGEALEYVPEPLRSAELCRIAVAQDGEALRYVPRDLRSEDLCFTAVAQNSWALRHVPQSIADDLIRRGALTPLWLPTTKEPPIPNQEISWDSSLLDRLEQAFMLQEAFQEEKMMETPPPNPTCNWTYPLATFDWQR